MMPMSSSVSPNQQQQMANHSVHFSSSSMMGSPHPMGHIGGPQHMIPHMQERLRPATHGGMTGPLRVGMPNQPHAMMPPNMSQHHGAMLRPGMGMGGMVTHQNVRMGAMGQVQMAGGPQYMHQHPSGHHVMHGHQMVNAGMPNQPQMGGQNMMGRHMMPGAPLHMQSNMIHHGNQSHMADLHQNSRFGVGAAAARPGVPVGGVPNNMMQDNSQLLGGGMNSSRLQGAANPLLRQNEGLVGGANAVRPSLAPPHNDVGGAGLRGMAPTQQQQQPVVNSTGQTMSTGGPTNSMPGISCSCTYAPSSWCRGV